MYLWRNKYGVKLKNLNTRNFGNTVEIEKKLEKWGSKDVDWHAFLQKPDFQNKAASNLGTDPSRMNSFMWIWPKNVDF